MTLSTLQNEIRIIISVIANELAPFNTKSTDSASLQGQVIRLQPIVTVNEHMAAEFQAGSIQIFPVIVYFSFWFDLLNQTVI